MDDVEGRVHAARRGDAAAWRALVDGHAGLVWSVIRGFRFDDETSADVFQTVWLRLAEHLDRIREPSRLAAWLARTAHNECVGVTRHRSRLVAVDDLDEIDLDAPGAGLVNGFPGPGDQLERDEARDAVATAFARLGPRCQELLRLLLCEPPLTYAEIAEVMNMPVGSIGPTRARCLDTLRSSPEVFRITGRLRPS